MLERFPAAAASNQFAQLIHLLRRKRLVEFQIQLHARQFKHVRQQQFRLQTRRFHIAAGQKFRAFLNAFENGHTATVNSRIRFLKSKVRPGCAMFDSMIRGAMHEGAVEFVPLECADVGLHFNFVAFVDIYDFPVVVSEHGVLSGG